MRSALMLCIRSVPAFLAALTAAALVSCTTQEYTNNIVAATDTLDIHDTLIRTVTLRDTLRYLS